MGRGHAAGGGIAELRGHLYDYADGPRAVVRTPFGWFLPTVSRRCRSCGASWRPDNGSDGRVLLRE